MMIHRSTVRGSRILHEWCRSEKLPALVTLSLERVEAHTSEGVVPRTLMSLRWLESGGSNLDKLTEIVDCMNEAVAIAKAIRATEFAQLKGVTK